MEETLPKFAADRTLKRLARWLRLLGADVLWEATLDGPAALHRGRAQARLVLTRDKRLRTAPDALYLSSPLFRAQLREVMARHPFNPWRFAFTRCLECNELLQTVARDLVARRVPPFVFAAHEQFAVCPRCDHIYWDATHPARVRQELEALGW
jgi:uncharacterized protein